MYPSVTYLYASPVEMQEYLSENLQYWSSYYNLNYEPMMKIYRQLLLEKPIVEQIKKEQLIDDEKILASFDLKTIKIEELESIQGYNIEFAALRDCNLHGFAFWFDVIFNTDYDIVTLSTSPSSNPTHWKQTIALLPEALDMFIENNNGKGASTLTETSGLALSRDQGFECFIIMNQADDNPRSYEIDIGIDLKSGNENDGEEEEEEDEKEEEHPMPCDCGKMKCLIIKATLEKYENESKENAS